MLSVWPSTQMLLGRSVQALAGGVPPWDGHREVGIIAGSLSVGLGMLTTGVPRPNDGTVAVAETLLEGATDFIELPVTHTGMLFSTAVAEQSICFFKSGAFRQLSDPT